MAGPLLYSANPYIKLLIQEQFRNDLHFVWCSETFDASLLNKYSLNANTPPSSNPADIYRDLRTAVGRKDRHCDKITQLRTSMVARAVAWREKGEINANDEQEITYLVNNAEIDFWRPVLFVIPRQPVEARLNRVAPDKRAGVGMEYTLADLKRTEFDTIELP